MAESVRKHLVGACSILELLLAYVRTVPRYSIAVSNVSCCSCWRVYPSLIYYE